MGRQASNSRKSMKLLVLLTAAIVVSFSAGYVVSYTNPSTGVGHDSIEVGPGKFGGGPGDSWTFPGNVIIENGLTVSSGSLEVTTGGIQSGGSMHSDLKVSTDKDSSCVLLPTFIGKTTSTFNGNRGGYTKANNKCVTKFSTYNKPHVCSNEEILRSIRCGITVEIEGWYNTGLWSITGTNRVNDCNGWESASSSYRGSLWYLDTSGWRPAWDECDDLNSFLCCAVPLPQP